MDVAMWTENTKKCRSSILCHSLGGKICPLLTITNFNSVSNTQSDSIISNRNYILISARVHPGESNSSFIMKGVIDFLLSDEPEAKDLLENFIFKIVPMLNPDGVIVGK